MKCEVKHNGDMGVGQLWLIMMGGAVMTLRCGYGLNGWGSYDKVAKICSPQNYPAIRYMQYVSKRDRPQKLRGRQLDGMR